MASLRDQRKKSKILHRDCVRFVSQKSRGPCSCRERNPRATLAARTAHGSYKRNTDRVASPPRRRAPGAATGISPSLIKFWRGSLMRRLSMTRSAISLLGCSALALWAATPLARADQPLLLPNSLVISSSTYDRTQGAVASLTVGTQLANTATSTTQAIADNNYVNIWNNASVDGSFGVTSPIELTVINPNSGHVFHTVAVPTDQVVTSFSSK